MPLYCYFYLLKRSDAGQKERLHVAIFWNALGAMTPVQKIGFIKSNLAYKFSIFLLINSNSPKKRLDNTMEYRIKLRSQWSGILMRILIKILKFKK